MVFQGRKEQSLGYNRMKIFPTVFRDILWDILEMGKFIPDT